MKKLSNILGLWLLMLGMVACESSDAPYLQWLKQLNTIRIVRLVSLCCFMQMEKKDILLLPMDCKLVRL